MVGLVIVKNRYVLIGILWVVGVYVKVVKVVEEVSNKILEKVVILGVGEYKLLVWLSVECGSFYFWYCLFEFKSIIFFWFIINSGFY